MTGNVPIRKRVFEQKKEFQNGEILNREKKLDKYTLKRLESIAKKKALEKNKND